MEQNTPASDERSRVEAFLGGRSKKAVSRAALIAVAAAALLILALVLFLRGAGGEPQYATAPVERGDLRVTVSATGNLAPTNEVEVGSELSGIVSRVYVDNNDRVTQGQLLAELDTARLQDTVRENQAALVSAEASVAQAQATLAETRSSLARQEEVHRLSGGRAPAATELDAARAAQARATANLSAARAAVGQARAALSSSRTQLSKAYIRSPVTGVVLARAVDPGQTVAATLNAPVLFRIAEDLAQMQLEVKVDEADVGQVKAGQSATFQVDAYPRRTFQAVVKRLDVGSTTTASTSGSGQVVAYTAVLGADNADLALRPGMTGTAAIVVAEKKDVLLVPNAALRFSPPAAEGAQARSAATDMFIPRRMASRPTERTVDIGRGSRQTIHVLTSKSDLQAVSVQVGDSNGAQTEVSSPQLQPGMRVVTGELSGDRARP